MMNVCRTSKYLTAAVVCVALLGAAAASPSPPPELLDRIVAFVDDEAILWSELNLRLQIELQQEGMRTIPGEEEIKRRRAGMLDTMLDEHILVSKARRDSVQVDASRVEEMLNAEIGRIKSDMSLEEFASMLERSGLSERQLKTRYRKQIRHQLLSEQFINQLAYRQFITRVDVEDFRAAHADTLPAKISLSNIQLKIRPAAEVLDEALEKITAIRARLDSGEAFADVARDASEDPGTRSEGGDLGCFGPGTLVPEFEIAADGLQLGDVSEPVLTEFGYHLILVREKRGSEICSQHILVRARSTDQDEERALARLAELRERALNGEEFAQLARDNSEDQTSARRGGLWAILQKDTIPPDIDAIISGMTLGELSEPFLVTDSPILAKGAYLFKINDDYATLEGLVREQLVARLMTDLIEDHREEIHVEVRLDDEFLWQRDHATY